MSASSLKMIYHTFFHSPTSCGIMFWGNASHSFTIFSMQKLQLELWKDVGIEFHVDIYLTNVTFNTTISIIYINVCSSQLIPFLNKQ
jgi:hypothetical protein